MTFKLSPSLRLNLLIRYANASIYKSNQSEKPCKYSSFVQIQHLHRELCVVFVCCCLFLDACFLFCVFFVNCIHFIVNRGIHIHRNMGLFLFGQTTYADCKKDFTPAMHPDVVYNTTNHRTILAFHDKLLEQMYDRFLTKCAEMEQLQKEHEQLKTEVKEMQNAMKFYRKQN